MDRVVGRGRRGGGESGARRGRAGKEPWRGGGRGGGGAVGEVAVRERGAIVGEWVSRNCGWLVAL